ncbi:unnamed protein product [Trifolium pratense]|uniref:Uncharacterized protein n=1 Tax=Trifolium pratense TaxID=57577 RepID=A0ACB0J291_TRIPR|nr:unnamed protein product [Trifolium pratense]
MGIEEAIDLRIKNIDIYGDSTLVINQIKGEWETRHAGLIRYRDYARRLLTFFNKVELHHIPRDENQMADALATLSSMYQVNRQNETPTISIRRLERPAYVFATEEVVDSKPWFHDIKMFLQKQEYPPGASNKDRKTLRRLSSSFFLNDEAFDRKVRPREFREGDLVLKKILSFQPDSKGKWTPNYEGPYVVKRAFSGGAMTLATMDGDELPRPPISPHHVISFEPKSQNIS